MACVQFFERCTNSGELVHSASQILVRPFFHNTSEPSSKRLSTRDSTKKIRETIHKLLLSCKTFIRCMIPSTSSQGMKWRAKRLIAIRNRFESRLPLSEFCHSFFSNCHPLIQSRPINAQGILTLSHQVFSTSTTNPRLFQ